MSIRVLCVGDIHFREDSYLEISLFIFKILKLIDSTELDLVVILGDTMHRHEKLHTSTLTRAMKFLYEIAVRKPLILLIGNHDRINNSVYMTDESPFYACRYWNTPNPIHIVDTTKEITLKNHRFICVPYVYPGRLKEALETLTLDWSQNTTCIFAHQEIRNCSMGSKKSKIGDIWNLDSPLLISGHIHTYEKLAENMIYVGTPHNTSYGESGKKTVSIFTFDPDHNYVEERMDLELPKKETVDYTPSEFMKMNINEFRFGVRIVIRGTRSELQSCIGHYNYEFLKKNNVKIKVKSIDDNSNSYMESNVTEIVKKEDLEKKIWNRLKEHDDLFKLFSSLFSNPNSKRLIIRVNRPPT